MALTELMNGSDIRGIAISTERGQANLTKDVTNVIAQGILKWFDEKKEKLGSPLRIAIGHDSRLSASELKQGLIEGFLTQEVTVLDVGLATTPALFMATQFAETKADIGVMITASHLPFYYNGIKLFTKEGGAEHEDIEWILTAAATYQVEKGNIGSVTAQELLPLYAQDLVKKIQEGTGTAQPLAGFHLVVDAGNGAGGFFAAAVLEPLGANTAGSQFLEPDGHFPNHMPNPDNKEAMASIQSAVLKEKADLGIIFDTDVDRAAVVDASGQVINRNNLIAVLATMVLEEVPGSTIVTNSPTSSHLKDFIELLGGHQVRYLCGYRNVINKAIELNQEGIETPLAIETSGHAAFKENYFLDDGAYVIAKILMLLPKLREKNQTISDLIAQLQQPAEAEEVRFRMCEVDDRKYGVKIIDELASFVKETAGMIEDPETDEGIRVTLTSPLGQGWFLLRLSLHEPLLVLQVENDEFGKNQRVFETLAPFFNRYANLDIEKLKNRLESGQ